MASFAVITRNVEYSWPADQLLNIHMPRGVLISWEMRLLAPVIMIVNPRIFVGKRHKMNRVFVYLNLVHLIGRSFFGIYKDFLL